MEDPDFINAKKLKPILEEAQTKVINLFEINKLLTAINKSRNPVAIELLKNLNRIKGEITVNDFLSTIKANDDIIMAMFSISYKRNFSLLMSLLKCIKDMTLLIEDKFTPQSNDYLKETFDFWKKIEI